MESQKKNTPKFRPNPSLKLMDQVREVLRYHHYAYRTEQTYCQWILRSIYYFGGKTHPNLLGAEDIFTQERPESAENSHPFPVYRPKPAFPRAYIICLPRFLNRPFPPIPGDKQQGPQLPGWSSRVCPQT